MVRSIRSLRVLVVVALLVAVLAPVAVMAAGGSFTDDETSIFESDINWMAASGVTQGCNPPANDHYCPDANVTRGQMAAFMHRLAINEVVAAADSVLLEGKSAETYTSPVTANDVGTGLAGAITGANQALSELTVDAPVAGYLLINVTDSLYDPDSAAQVFFWLQVDDSACKNSSPSVDSVAFGYATTPTGGGRQGMALTGAGSVDAGSHTVTFCARGSAGNTQFYEPSMTVLATATGAITP